MIQKLRFLVNHGKGGLRWTLRQWKSSSDAVIWNQQSLLLIQDKRHLILFYSFWRLLNHNTHALTVYQPETSDWPTVRHPFEGELLVFAERAVTTDGRYMFPAELVQGRFRPAWKKKRRKKKGRLHVLLCLLVLCIVCCINVNTSVKNSSERPPTDWHAEPSGGVDVHPAVWCLCYHLLNVCVSLRAYVFWCNKVQQVVQPAHTQSMAATKWVKWRSSRFCCVTCSQPTSTSHWLIFHICRINILTLRSNRSFLFPNDPVWDTFVRPGF